MISDRKFLVIRGNTEIETGTVTTEPRRFSLDSRDFIPYKESKTVLECIDIANPNRRITPFATPKKYKIYDRYDFSDEKFPRQTLNNYIFNKCIFRDVTMFRCKLNHVIFYNCIIDIMELGQSTLNNVQFLYTKEGLARALKIDFCDINNLVLFKTDSSRPIDLDQNELIQIDKQHYIINSKKV